MIGIVIKSFKESRFNTLSCLLLPYFKLISVILELAFAYLLINIYQQPIAVANKILYIIGFIVIYSAIDLITNTWETKVVNTRYRTIRIFKEELLRKLLENSYQTFEDENTEKLYYEALEAVNGGFLGVGGVVYQIKDIIFTILKIVLCLGVLSFIEPKLMWLLIIFLLVFYTLTYFTYKTEQHKRASSNREVARQGKLQKYLTSYEYAKELRIFPFTEMFIRKHQDNSKHIKNSYFKFGIRNILINLLITTALVALMASVFWILFKNGPYTSGLLIVCFMTLGLYVNSLGEINTHLKKIAKTKVYVDQYNKFMSIESIETNQNDIKDISSSKRKELSYLFDKSSWKLEFINVSFKYNENDLVLKNINFTINAQDKICILGKNGSGKSTLLNIIIGLLDVTSGEILFNGININQLNSEERLMLTSVIFQEPVLYSESINRNLSIEEMADGKKQYLQNTDIASLQRLSGKEIMTKHFVDNGILLSGGETQKFSYARSKFKKSLIDVFDEPTAAMDPISKRNFFNMILSSNQTVVIVTHDMESIIEFEKCLVLDGGEVVFSGSGVVLANDSLFMAMCSEGEVEL